jgi:putative heme-binding domain-containing protein
LGTLRETSLYPKPAERFRILRAALNLVPWLKVKPRATPLPAVQEPALGLADPLLAYTARLALEHQEQAKWRKEALAEQDPAVLLNAGLALARTHDKAAAAELLDRIVTLDAAKLPVGQLLSLIQIYAICREHTPEEAAARKEKILSQLDPLFPLPPRLALAVSPLGTGVQAQRELARALVELNAPGIVDRVAKTLLPPVADAQGSRLEAKESRLVPQEDRIHALLILRHFREGWTPATRRQYFETLRDAAGFVAGEGMPKFLAHFREEATATLTEAERKELGDLLKAEPAAEEFAPPPARPLVKAWTLEDLQPLWADNERRGDAARGAVLFREALCVRCHKAGLRGPAVGPDLTYVAGRFSRRDLLASMLTPSQVVAENYRNVQVTTTDGRVLLGRVVVGGDYRSETLRIATDPLKPTAVIELSKRDIESTRESPISPMPEGLLNTLKLEEILDLLTFLEQGK